MHSVQNIILKYSKKGPKFQIKKLEEDLKSIKSDLPGVSSNPQEDLFLYRESLIAPPKCPCCNKPKQFINYKRGYQNTCHTQECIQKYTQIKREESFIKKYGVKNPKQIKEVAEKIEQTNLERYGHKNAASSSQIKIKIKDTFIENYGVDNPMKSKEIKDKVKATNLEKYGVENTYQLQKVLDKIKEKYGDNFGFGSEFFKEKSKETCNEKWGVEYHLQRPEIHKVITETMTEVYGGRGLGSDEIRNKIYDAVESKYGNRHPMHNEKIKKKIEDTHLDKHNETHHMKVSEFFDKHLKTSFKTKEYIMPSGKIVNVQGYEPYGINWFLQNGYTEEDLIIETKDIEALIGKVKYQNPLKNKESRYYPDFYVKSENCVIEVKSDYTYNKNKNINELKKSACIEAGLNFKFMIYANVSNKNINFYFL